LGYHKSRELDKEVEVDEHIQGKFGITPRADILLPVDALHAATYPTAKTFGKMVGGRSLA
jgi:hypothetical protein